MRISLDSSAIIYGLEGRPRVRDEVVRVQFTGGAFQRTHIHRGIRHRFGAVGCH